MPGPPELIGERLAEQGPVVGQDHAQRHGAAYLPVAWPPSSGTPAVTNVPDERFRISRAALIRRSRPHCRPPPARRHRRIGLAGQQLPSQIWWPRGPARTQLRFRLTPNGYFDYKVV